MPFSDNGYDPETLAFLKECLAIATDAASRVLGTPVSDQLRDRLALAIIEGAETDIGTKDELVDFALSSLPEFRSRLAN